MLEVLDNEDTHFQCMVLDANTYQLCKVNSKEILVDGEMYDVKSIRYSKEKVELLVIHDKHEGSILKRIGRLIVGNSDQESTVPVLVIKLISLNYISSLPEFWFNEFVLSRSFFIEGTVYFSSHISEISSPPPKA